MKTITILLAILFLSILLPGCYITTEYCYVDEYTPPDSPIEPYYPPTIIVDPTPPSIIVQPVYVLQPSPQPVRPRPTITGHRPINGNTTPSSLYDYCNSQTRRGSVHSSSQESYQNSTHGSDRGNQSSTSKNEENSKVRDSGARGKR